MFLRYFFNLQMYYFFLNSEKKFCRMAKYEYFCI